MAKHKTTSEEAAEIAAAAAAEARADAEAKAKKHSEPEEDEESEESLEAALEEAARLDAEIAAHKAQIASDAAETYGAPAKETEEPSEKPDLGETAPVAEETQTNEPPAAEEAAAGWVEPPLPFEDLPEPVSPEAEEMASAFIRLLEKAQAETEALMEELREKYPLIHAQVEAHFFPQSVDRDEEAWEAVDFCDIVAFSPEALYCIFQAFVEHVPVEFMSHTAQWIGPRVVRIGCPNEAGGHNTWDVEIPETIMLPCKEAKFGG